MRVFAKRFLFFWLFLAMACGELLCMAGLRSGDPAVVALPLVFAAAAALGLFVSRRGNFGAAALLFFLFGAVLVSAERLVWLKSAPLLREPFSCRLSGTVATFPRSFAMYGKKLHGRYITGFVLAADDVACVHGLGGERVFVRMATWEIPDLSLGRRIAFDARVGDGGWSWREWIAGRPRLCARVRAGAEVETLGGGWNRMRSLRAELLGFLESAVSAPGEEFARENAVLAAAVAGNRADLDPELWESFKRSGTLHLIAISGLHFGLAAFFLWLLSGLVPGMLRRERARTALCLAATVFYAALLGPGYPSVLRACVFVGACLCARLFAREACMLNVLGMAGILICVFRPLELFSLGFTLSFFIVFALLAVRPMPLLESRFPRLCEHGWLRAGAQTLCVSVVAWLASGVVLLPALGQLSVAGLFVNPLAVMLFSLIMSAAFLSVFFALCSSAPAAVLASANVWCVRGLCVMIESVSGLPGAYREFSGLFARIGIAGLFLTLLAAVAFACWLKQRHAAQRYL